MYSYTGKILRIDLSKNKISEENLQQSELHIATLLERTTTLEQLNDKYTELEKEYKEQTSFIVTLKEENSKYKTSLEVKEKRMTEILFDKGYILSYKFIDEKPQGKIKIALKYHPVTKSPAIKNLERVSKPGLRKYVDSENLPRVMNGLGIAVISTSNGLMTDKEARAQKIGGEVICYVY